MIEVEYVFYPKERNSTLDDEYAGLVELFMSMCQMNGCVIEPRDFGYWKDNTYRVNCLVDRTEGLEEPVVFTKSDSKWANELMSASSNRPTIKVLSTETKANDVDWNKCSSLLFSGSHFVIRSPIVAGCSGQKVPLFTLPAGVRQPDIVRWNLQYSTYWKVFTWGNHIEEAAYFELASINSQLAKWGRQLAQGIERETGIRTYYVLDRVYGRSGEGEELQCPGCGAKWCNPAKYGATGIDSLSCRCDECRLVQTDPTLFDNEWMARIGEYTEERLQGIDEQTQELLDSDEVSIKKWIINEDTGSVSAEVYVFDGGMRTSGILEFLNSKLVLVNEVTPPDDEHQTDVLNDIKKLDQLCDGKRLDYVRTSFGYRIVESSGIRFSGSDVVKLDLYK